MGHLPPKTIAETLRGIQANELVPPAIQREYGWKPSQVVRLFDSILRGYLIGSFLAWCIDPETFERVKFYGPLEDYSQERNLIHLLARLALSKNQADEMAVLLLTKEGDPEYEAQHLTRLHEISEPATATASGLRFTVKFDDSTRDRWNRADTGWKILLGRGLDNFQKGAGSQFDLGPRQQEFQFRQIAAFGVTCVREYVRG
ncbi:MIT C-terminal domain-containing protein [Microbacterium sp. Marseille-Q6965]|uniref:MIT C-terminal domain-containing protein n=1 Tax=Microbacterium sp. Marseille-Q6965 TaxID=2965072 RepID=UPI0021B79F07|nr:MIT C-terminal domain-containing protein [Microbacterium sp. Marseille-Q6965]